MPRSPTPKLSKHALREPKKRQEIRLLRQNQMLQQMESMAAHEWKRNRARLIRAFIGPRGVTTGIKKLKLTKDEQATLDKQLANAFTAHQKKWADKTHSAKEHLQKLYELGL